MGALIAAHMPPTHVLKGRVVEAVRAEGKALGQLAAGRVEVEQLEPINGASAFKVKPDLGVFGRGDGVGFLQNVKN